MEEDYFLIVRRTPPRRPIDSGARTVPCGEDSRPRPRGVRGLLRRTHGISLGQRREGAVFRRCGRGTQVGISFERVLDTGVDGSPLDDSLRKIRKLLRQPHDAVFGGGLWEEREKELLLFKRKAQKFLVHEDGRPPGGGLGSMMGVFTSP